VDHHLVPRNLYKCKEVVLLPHAKELTKDLRIRFVALHKVDLGYKKIGDTLKLSFSTGQGHTEVF